MSDLHKTMEAYLSMVSEKKLDPVNKKELNKDFDDREDKDIDNDGDTDSSDEYLHKRRKAIKKAMAKESIELDEISAKLARSARDKAKASELDHKMKAYDKISKTKNIPFISKIGKKAAEPDVKMADRRKRQANLANRKLGGMGDYEYDDKGKYRRQGPAKVLAKEEVDVSTKSVDKALSHDFAKHVTSEQWGFGECIHGQYSLVEYADGSVEVTHYDVMFEHGVEFDVPVEELTVLMSETYEYVTESEELDKEEEDPKKKKPFPPKKDGEEKDSDDDDDEDEVESDEEEKPKVVGKKEKDKNPRTSDKTAEISKIGEAFDELWSAMQEAINQKKGATEPEKMDSKASPKEKEFASKHVADVKGVKGKKLSDADDPEKPSKTVKTEMKEFEVIRALLSGNPTGE